MKDDFAELCQFWERCGQQAHGHGLVASDREWIDLIDRFVAGQCDSWERRQLAQFLQSHPEMIHQIAERVERAGEHPEKSNAGPPKKAT